MLKRLINLAVQIKMAAQRLFFFSLLAFVGDVWASSFEITVMLPTINTHNHEALVCSAFKIPSGGNYFVEKMELIGNVSNLFHWIVHGCDQPGHLDAAGYKDYLPKTQDVGESSEFWSCLGDEETASNTVCESGGMMLFDTPHPVTPLGLGKEIGPRSNLHYFVFNIHHKPQPSHIKLGFKITITEKSDPEVGTFVILAQTESGTLTPMSESNIDCITRFHSSVPVTIYGGQFHSHTKGQEAWFYKIDEHGQWTLISNGVPSDPAIQQPEKEVVLSEGDVLALRCHMVNPENRTITMGVFHGHEFCGVKVFYTFPNQPSYASAGIKPKCFSPEDAKIALKDTYFPE